MTEDIKKFTRWHEDMIRGNQELSTQNRKRIEALQNNSIRTDEQINKVCSQVDTLSRTLWWLGTSIFGFLIIAIITYILRLIEIM